MQVQKNMSKKIPSLWAFLKKEIFLTAIQKILFKKYKNLFFRKKFFNALRILYILIIFPLYIAKKI